MQIVLSFEVKKCESSTLFFFSWKKKRAIPHLALADWVRAQGHPHLPWVTGHSPPTHRHSTEEARRPLPPTVPPSFPESPMSPRHFVAVLKSSQVAPSGARGGAAWAEAAALASAAGSGRQACVCASLSACPLAWDLRTVLGAAFDLACLLPSLN